MVTRITSLVLLCLALGVLSGCSARQGPQTMDSIARAIDGLSDEELWLCGKAAAQAQEYLRAAMCFSLLADRAEIGARWREATLGAAQAWERLGDWERALHRYHAAYEPDGPDALELTWKLATAYYELDRYPEALELLDPLLEREDLSLEDRLRARTWRAICMVELGEWDEAELELRRALFAHRRERSRERVDTYVLGQAQFFIGEIFRLRFESVAIEQTDDIPRLSETIEQKSDYLLSAQGHYVRTLRIGHPHWTTAAGQRIGELYETFYDEMIEAPIPTELTPEQAELYRLELRRKVRILVQKAIAAYERTLTVAERLGLDTAFVERTRAGLERMEKLLLEAPGKETGDSSRGEGEATEDEAARGTTAARGGSR